MSDSQPNIEKAQTDCESCNQGNCSAKVEHMDESEAEHLDRQALCRRLCQIERKVLVMSGKGGVGKSTVAVNLATWLSMQGKRVGLLDVDIHGPSVPRMLGLTGSPVHAHEGSLLPVAVGDLFVMSIGFLLHNDDEAVIWRGPRKASMIKQFISDVEWGCLDYLVVDAPPGTGDEPLSVCQMLDHVGGAVIVTTPQQVALSAVRKSIGFCRKLDVPVIGVVENMSGYICPGCGERVEIFTVGGGERMARELEVPFLGRIPIDPSLTRACDDGTPFVQRFAQSETAKALDTVFRPVLTW